MALFASSRYKIIFSIYFLLITGNSSAVSDDEILKELIKYGNVTSPPNLDPTSSIDVVSKDLTINNLKHTWARIFMPRKVFNNSSPNKLPLIVFFHGGGFVAGRASTSSVHKFLFNLTKTTESVAVSVDYRLAPKHRLPAAYKDSFEALQWIKSTNDSWLTRYTNYSQCYLMGESAGGNIAYFVGLRAAEEVDCLAPLKIHGLILIQPFFGGVCRTPSELNMMDQVEVTDAAWRMSLPIGADRDHMYSNPIVNGGAKGLDHIKCLGWKVVIFGCNGDPLVDREREATAFFKKKGMNVLGKFYRKGKHGSFMSKPMSRKVYNLVKTLH